MKAPNMPERTGEATAIVIVKAAPQVGQRHGETVCCAGLDPQGRWLRLYPVSFRTLEDGQKFGRWDRIQFKWRLPKDDQRPESRRVDQHTLAVVGQLRQRERAQFLAGTIVTSLEREREAGKSLALLRAEIVDFRVELRPPDEVESDRSRFVAFQLQTDLFNSKAILPYQPCPFRFKYRYRTDDGSREGTCQDWEIEATYWRWARQYGRDTALARIQQVFGEELPAKGIVLAMGTHSRYPDTWLINGVVRVHETEQLPLALD